MGNESATPLVSFAGGFFSGRVESTMRESAQATYYNLLSVDAGLLGTGATVTGSQTTQNTGYQIQASNTWFSTVAAGGVCVLPQTSRPDPFSGLMIFIVNTGANNLLCFPHPNDPNNSINSLALNASVILGPRSITPFQCFTPGIWFADSIGTGFAGSIETIVPQGPLTASTTQTQAAGTSITQALAQFGTVANPSDAGTLMPAKAGMIVTVVNSGANTMSIFPASQGQGGVSGGDKFNSQGQNAALTGGISNTVPMIFNCIVDGTWWNK